MSRIIKSNSGNKLDFIRQNWVTLVLKILLVCIFAWIEWRFKYRFYPIFIVCFFVVSLLFKTRRYFDFTMAIIIVFIILNTTTLNGLSQIKDINNQFIQNPDEGLSLAFKPNTGLEVLPLPVQKMIQMISDNNIESYRLSPKFSEDDEIVQRVVEAAWPVKLEKTSSFIFITTDETDQYQNCTIIDDSEDLTLVDCH